jgi:two-component system copper resistance phosphate regulon response regulator CusR
MVNILLVEDEKKLIAFIEQGLKEAGHKVEAAETSADAQKILKNSKFDLIILDVMLGETSGLDFAKTLRAEGYTGSILMLTALATTQDKILGLDAGADDYLTKPFEFEELLARVRALLRRHSDEHFILKNGQLIVDLITRSVVREGVKLDLTTKEFSLLEFLMRNLSKVVSREAIAKQVWNSDFDPDSNVIDVYINHLRKKVDSPFPKKLLKTVVGQGYVLNRFE